MALDDVIENRALIHRSFLDTPLRRSRRLDEFARATVHLKDETTGAVRSFKGRGTDLLAKRDLTPGEPIVTASAGNFGLGLSLAGKTHGHAVTIFAASNANAAKIEAIKGLGATVVLDGRDFDEAKERAREWSAAQGIRFVEDGVDAAFTEGAATIGYEIVRDCERLDLLYVPVGNGALAEGVAGFVKSVAPGIKVVGVVAAGAPCMMESILAGEARTGNAVDTIADGVAVRVPVLRAVKALHSLLDDVVAVADSEIEEAMRLLHETTGLVAEPSAVLGLCAMIRDADAIEGTQVATILTGANLTQAQLERWFPTRR